MLTVHFIIVFKCIQYYSEHKCTYIRIIYHGYFSLQVVIHLRVTAYKVTNVRINIIYKFQ